MPRKRLLLKLAPALAVSVWLLWNLSKPAQATSELRNAIAGGGDYSLRQRIYQLLMGLSQALPAWLTLKQAWMAVAAVLFATLVFLVVAPMRTRRRWLASPVLFGAAAVLFILFLRLPYLALGSLNNDEAQFIATALRLERDPLFFRSVQTGTSGPLTSYALWLPKALGLQLDFATARLVGLLFFCSGILLCYRALARSVREETGRVAVLPLIVLTALLTEPNYVHYSSEQVPVLLFCLGFYLFVRFRGGGAGWAVAFGVLLTLGFFAKLQALPLLAGLAAVALASAFTATGSGFAAAGYMALGFAPTFALAIAAIYLTGGWVIFRHEYLLSNLSYSQVSPFSVDLFWFLRSNAEIRRFPLLAVIVGLEAVCRRLWTPRKARDPLRPVQIALAAGGVLTLFSLAANIMGYRGHGLSFAWLALGLYAAAVAVWMVFQMARGSLALQNEDWILAATVVSLLAAAYAIIKPNRPFLHYFNLMIVPAGLLWAVVYLYASRDVDSERPSRASGSTPDPGPEVIPSGTGRHRWASALLPCIFLLFSVGLADTTRTNGVWGPHPVLEHLDSIPRTLGGPAAQAIASVTRPGERMSIWGMEPHLFYETALIPATQSAVNAYLGLATATDSEFALYVRELERTPPPVFVDAVGPGRFWLEDRSRTGHEVIPALRGFVDSHYQLLSDTEGYRVYVRKDRAH